MKDEIKDERIQTTISRCAALGFFVSSLLLMISFCYRALILEQHPREWWDIVAILLIGILVVFIAGATKGVFARSFKRFWLPWLIGHFIVYLTLSFLMGTMRSVVNVGGFLVSLLLGMGLVIGIAYFLNRRWKRREGIEDEK